MKEFEQIIKEAEKQEEIVGLILLGSRGKGFENEYSDYDAVMIVKDEFAGAFRERYGKRDFNNVELVIMSISDFKKYAEWGSPESWDKYDYAHTKILVDKTNDLPALVKEKGFVPAEKLEEFIGGCIDGYVNGAYRSIKCIRNNNLFGARLEASNSMLDLLTCVFAFNGRCRPFLGYVEKELEKYPLEYLPWHSIELLAKIEKVLATADLKTQQELLMGIEKMSRETGHGKVFDGWKGKDKWAMEYKPAVKSKTKQ